MRRVNPPSASTDEGTVKDEESARVAIEEKKKKTRTHICGRKILLAERRRESR